MGYDLHFARRKFWSDDEGPVITAEEWLAYVATDSQIRLDPDGKGHTVLLTVASKYPGPWLEWSEVTSIRRIRMNQFSPKMLQVASALNARVRGDDGEIYRSASFEDF